MLHLLLDFVQIRRQILLLFAHILQNILLALCPRFLYSFDFILNGSANGGKVFLMEADQVLNLLQLLIFLT